MNPDKPPTDRRLLNAANAGDGESFGELFERHRDRVFRHVFGVLNDAAVAEDVTAMVFYEAWRKRHAIRVVDPSVLPWLLVTANYTMRNQRRQQRRYQHFLDQLPDPSHAPDIAEDVVDRHQASAEHQLVREAFNSLNAQSRDVLTLCIIGNSPSRMPRPCWMCRRAPSSLDCPARKEN